MQGDRKSENLDESLNKSFNLQILTPEESN